MVRAQVLVVAQVQVVVLVRDQVAAQAQVVAQAQVLALVVAQAQAPDGVGLARDLAVVLALVVVRVQDPAQGVVRGLVLAQEVARVQELLLVPVGGVLVPVLRRAPLLLI